MTQSWNSSANQGFADCLSVDSSPRSTVRLSPGPWRCSENRKSSVTLFLLCFLRFMIFVFPNGNSTRMLYPACSIFRTLMLLINFIFHNGGLQCRQECSNVLVFFADFIFHSQNGRCLTGTEIAWIPEKSFISLVDQGFTDSMVFGPLGPN